MRKLIMLLLGMVCAYGAFTQEGKYIGSVIDESNNAPLVGAKVEINGIQKVLTNEKGEFTYSCAQEKAKIKVYFIGFETYTGEFGCGSVVEIKLRPDTRNLNAVEITAISNSDNNMLEQPSSIVRMNEDEIKRGVGLYMDDAINTNVPGVMMERRTQSAGQQINVRGYGNGMGFKGVSNNFDTQGLKVYLNGILITDAEGLTVMDDIDLGSVSNVEILKGPSGTLYGLAIAGVVNLQIKAPSMNTNSISQEIIGGSYGLFRSTTRLNVGGEKSSVMLNYGHQIYDGFMAHTKSRKDFVNFVGNFALNEKQYVSTYFGYTDSYDQRNGELTKGQYDTLDYSGNTRYINNDAHSAVRTFRAGMSHEYTFNSHFSNTTSIFGSSQNIDQSSAGGWTDKSPLNYGFRSVVNMKFDLGKKVKLSGITGIEAQKMNVQSLAFRMGADSTNLSGYNTITDLRTIQSGVNSTYNYFTQWTLGLPYGISVNAGVGVSNMHIQLNDRLWGMNNNVTGSTIPKDYNLKYNNLVSPSFAVNKTISKILSVYASYSTGYKAPVSSNTIISYTGEPNTGLMPEKGTQFEVGTKGQMMDNRLFYTVAFFNARFSDKFTTQTVQDANNTVTLYSYIVNGGDLNNTGVEALIKWNVMKSDEGFVKTLQPFANFTYSNFKYENYRFETIGDDINGNDSTIVNDYSGKVVAGVCPIVLNAGIDVDTKIGLFANVTFNYRSSMYYTSDGLNETEPYSLLNAKLGYRKSFGKFDLNVYGGANNITSSQYYNMVFVNQLPDAYIPGPNKVIFFGGLNVKYSF